MCRHAAYVGPPLSVAAFVKAPEHSLYVQSHSAEELAEGSVCADGWGFGWYESAQDDDPGRYRSDKPIWADRNLDDVAAKIQGSMILASVRQATEPGSNTEANCHPFHYRGYLFAHNGYVKPFREKLLKRIRDGLPDDLYAAVRGSTDSELIFAMLMASVRERDGNAEKAVVETTRRVAEMSQEASGVARLNFLLADGKHVWATRFSTDPPANSLYVAERVKGFGGGTLVASEAMTSEDPWRKVDEGTLLVVDHKGKVDERRL